MDEYRLFWLSPGQKSPDGSTGIMLRNGGIMWTGVSGTFATEAILGTKLATDPDFETDYDSRLATEEEITIYNDYLSGDEEGE